MRLKTGMDPVARTDPEWTFLLPISFPFLSLFSTHMFNVRFSATLSRNYLTTIHFMSL